MGPQIQLPLRRPRRPTVLGSVLRIVAAAGLGLDAYVHLVLAGGNPRMRPAT